MNNNVENYVEDAFDEMLDSVKSIHDDFINSYYDTEEEPKKIENKPDKSIENKEYYDEKELKELSNHLNKELFSKEEIINKNVENYVEKENNSIKTEEDVMNLIENTNSSEEFWNIIDGKNND